MTTKLDWINDFMDFLYYYHDNDINTTYAYQLAVAYFDWGDDGVPEHTVEQAIERYKENQQ